MEKLSAIEQSLARIEQSTSNSTSSQDIVIKPETTSTTSLTTKVCGKRKLTPQETFDSAFYALLEAHANLPQADRPLKLQKVISDCSTSQKSNFEELLNNASASLSRSKFIVPSVLLPIDTGNIEISEEFLKRIFVNIFPILLLYL